MSSIDELLARSGLEPRIRVLCMTGLAALAGDSNRLTEVVAAARRGSVPRADLEEVLLQGVLFYGFPRSVTAFGVLGDAWPTTAAPRGGGLARGDQERAGRVLFDAIYAHNAPAVHEMLRGFHQEFHDFVLESAYGRVLTRPGLPPRDRELLAVAVLAAMEQTPQMVAHGRGALHFGADQLEVREAIVTAIGDGPDVDGWIRRISAGDAGRSGAVRP